ncbi:MAG: 6-carboxytetrahydropterin synthase [Elusimicrobiales bacterium]
MLKQHNQKIFLLDKNPTAEFIALVVKDSLKRIGLNVKSVILWENSTSMAEVKEE